MALENVTFRVGNTSPLCDFTREHPGVTVSLWCNWEYDVFEVQGSTRAQAMALQEMLENACAGTELHALGDATHVVVSPCTSVPHAETITRIDKAKCLHVPPNKFRDGWEHCSMVSFSDDGTRELFRMLREEGWDVDLVAKRRLDRQENMLAPGGIGIASLIAALTDKQAEAVVLAHRHGLYDSPRRTTAANIASSLGLSRSTYEEHLRKAENRLLGNLAPYVELHVGTKRLRQTATVAPASRN